MVKKCLKCGKILDHSAKFCSNCGTAQKSALSETGEGYIKKVFDALTSIIHTIVGKIGVKKCAKYGSLALILVLLIGIIYARSHTQKSCEWAKSHSEDGTMYIYTIDELSGTVTDISNKKSKVYPCLYQDKESFFITLKDDDENDIVNSGSDPLSVDATIIYHKGTKKEFPQDFTATLTGNKIRFSSESNGYIQSALEDEDLQSSPLILNFPDGRVCRMTMPGENTYREIWESVCDFWYIPTFNDDIYKGEEVNPDLRSYLEQFEDALYAEIEKREEMGATRTLLGDLLDVNSNPELNAMYEKYQEMENLTRTVDAAYYAECKSRVDTVLAKHTIDQGLELGQDIVDLADLLGFD